MKKNRMQSHSSKFPNVWEWETEEWGRVSLGEQAWEQRHGGLFYGNQWRKLLDDIAYFKDAYGNPRVIPMAPVFVYVKII